MSENKGWECPKCGKVNAPWKESCRCVVDIVFKIESEISTEADRLELVKWLNDYVEKNSGRLTASEVPQ